MRLGLSRSALFKLVIQISLIIVTVARSTRTPKPFITRQCDADAKEAYLAKIEDHLDLTVDACDDFYEYACGNWRVPYKLRILNAKDALSSVKADNKRLLIQRFDQIEYNRSRIHTAPTVEQQPVPVSAVLEEMQQNVQRFYRSCINAHLSAGSMRDAENGIRVYIEELKSLGRWPALHATYSPSTDGLFQWQQISAKLRRYGVQTLWRLLVQSNWQASEQTIFYIATPSFSLLKKSESADSYDDNSVFLYERYVKYLMLDLGVRVRTAKEVARKVVQFEKQLLELARGEQAVIKLREPQSLASIAIQLPNLDLHTYFDTLLEEFQLDSNTVANLTIVADMNYLQQLNDFIETSTDDAINMYFVVQFLAHFELHMHDEDTFSEQQEYCLQQANNYMPMQLSAVFLEILHGNDNVLEYVNEVEQQLGQVFEKLKLQFEHLLNATHVFERDNVTRALGLEKLHAMRLQLPNLQQFVAEQQQRQQQSAEEVVRVSANNFSINENYDLNVLNLAKQRVHAELAIAINSAAVLPPQTVTPVPTTKDIANQSTVDDSGTGNVVATNNNSHESTSENDIEQSTTILMESSTPSTTNPASSSSSASAYMSAYGPLHVNAYYRLKRNAIEIPFGILRPPFYDKCSLGLPQLYGSFVYILAHELLHGFDYDGLNYDKVGNVANNWSAKSIIDYGSKAKCFLTPRYRNAALTINENIADSEGLRLALETFVLGGDGGGSALEADALRWFFISFAQTWCGTSAAATSVGTTRMQSLHAANKERVNNVVANFEEFAQVFKCSAIDALNPEEKCKIW